MWLKFLAGILTLLLCSACGATVSPIATPTGTINVEEKSITEIRENVAITVKLDEFSVAPYQMVDNITSFWVEIDNQSDQQVSYPSKLFLLKDGNRKQYRTISPERVREIVSKDTVYLIPYPYVGYYYLEDHMSAAHNEAFSSSAPFYAEYHPQDIFTRALTEEPVLQDSKVSGAIYFLADMEKTDFAEVQIFPDETLSGEPSLRFPFAIEK